MFDELTLLSEGLLIFTGDMTQVTPFFNSQGYKVPANTNPIEHYVDLLSIDYSSPETEEESKHRIVSLSEAFHKQYLEPW